MVMAVMVVRLLLLLAKWCATHVGIQELTLHSRSPNRGLLVEGIRNQVTASVATGSPIALICVEDQLVTTANLVHVNDPGVVVDDTELDEFTVQVVGVELGAALEPPEDGLVHWVQVIRTVRSDPVLRRHEG